MYLLLMICLAPVALLLSCGPCGPCKGACGGCGEGCGDCDAECAPTSCAVGCVKLCVPIQLACVNCTRCCGGAKCGAKCGAKGGMIYRNVPSTGNLRKVAQSEELKTCVLLLIPYAQTISLVGKISVGQPGPVQKAEDAAEAVDPFFLADWMRVPCFLAGPGLTAVGRLTLNMLIPAMLFAVAHCVLLIPPREAAADRGAKGHQLGLRVEPVLGADEHLLDHDPHHVPVHLHAVQAPAAFPLARGPGGV